MRPRSQACVTAFDCSAQPQNIAIASSTCNEKSINATFGSLINLIISTVKELPAYFSVFLLDVVNFVSQLYGVFPKRQRALCRS